MVHGYLFTRALIWIFQWHYTEDVIHFFLSIQEIFHFVVDFFPMLEPGFLSDLEDEEPWMVLPLLARLQSKLGMFHEYWLGVYEDAGAFTGFGKTGLQVLNRPGLGLVIVPLWEYGSLGQRTQGERSSCFSFMVGCRKTQTGCTWKLV